MPAVSLHKFDDPWDYIHGIISHYRADGNVLETLDSIKSPKTYAPDCVVEGLYTLKFRGKPYNVKKRHP